MDLLGPAPAFATRVRGEYQWHVIMRSHGDNEGDIRAEAWIGGSNEREPSGKAEAERADVLAAEALAERAGGVSDSFGGLR